VAKTQYYTATSIDGFIADAGNSLDWLFQVWSGSEAANDRFGPFMAGVGAMAMGAQPGLTSRAGGTGRPRPVSPYGR
jgi:hypothetical protein